MQFHSPYLGMGNNPISMIDPDGGQAISRGSGVLKGSYPPGGNNSLSKVNSSSFNWATFGIGLGIAAIGASVEGGAATSAAAKSQVALLPELSYNTPSSPRGWNSNSWYRPSWNALFYDFGTIYENLTYENPNVTGTYPGFMDWVGGVGPAKGAINAAKGASKFAKNARKMLPDEIGDFLQAGKNWHKGSAKGDFLKQFKKALKGDTNADFYIDETTKDVFLKSNKSGKWINTGQKFE